MTTLTRAFALAAVWLSPAALLAVGPMLLLDGTRGLWPPLVLATGALLTAVLLRPPGASTLSSQGSWLATGVGLIAAPGIVSTWLFLWAQLAAGRQLATAIGWSPRVAIGLLVVGLILAAWRGAVGWWLVAGGGAVLSLGLGACLLAVMMATTPVWPGVWGAVASRPRMAFSEDGPWTRGGHPLRGPARELTVRVGEDQRVTLLGRGRIRVELWEGGTSSRDVRIDTDVTLRAGDRLVIPEGFPVRFAAGHAIPGAPVSGPDWLDPAGLRPDGRALAGLAFTLLLGALGLAPVHAALAAVRTGDRAAPLAAGVVIFGCLGVTLWTLYVVWLTPEVYIGGVAPVEVYEFPVGVAALDAAAGPVRVVALLSLAAGGVAAALAAMLALASAAGGRKDASPLVTLVTVAAGLAGAGVLATWTPVEPWSLLLGAFGLAGAASAPAAILGCWRERLSARALVVGAGLGFVVFVALSILPLAGLLRAPGGSWTAWLVSWPVVVAAPANAAVAWLWGRRPAGPAGAS